MAEYIWKLWLYFCWSAGSSHTGFSHSSEAEDLLTPSLMNFGCGISLSRLGSKQGMFGPRDFIYGSISQSSQLPYRRKKSRNHHRSVLWLVFMVLHLESAAWDTPTILKALNLCIKKLEWILFPLPILNLKQYTYFCILDEPFNITYIWSFLLLNCLSSQLILLWLLIYLQFCPLILSHWNSPFLLFCGMNFFMRVYLLFHTFSTC